MQGREKRFLSFILAVVMVLGLVCGMSKKVYAYSSGEIAGTTGTGTASDPVIVDTFKELKEALEYNGTLYIQVDSFKNTKGLYYYSLSDSDYVNGEPVISQIGTKYLTINTNIVVQINSLSSTCNTFINVNGNLYLYGNGSIKGGLAGGAYSFGRVFFISSTGKLYCNGPDIIGENMFLAKGNEAIVVNSGELEINSGCFSGFTDKDDFVNGNAYGVVVNSSAKKVTINGGTFNSDTNKTDFSRMGFCCYSGKTEINGGVFVGIQMGSSLKISDILAPGTKLFDDDSNEVSANVSKINDCVYALKKLYEVTVSRGTADKTTAYPGEIVTVTAEEPGEGWAFNYWTITGGGVMMNTSYTSKTSFTMPDGDVTAIPSYKWIGGYIKEFKAYVTPPVAGEHPQDATVKTDEYTVRKTIWAGEEEGRKLTSNDTFIEGNHYACYVYLTNLAKPYDGDMIGYINDSSENVSIVNSNYQGKMGVRIGSDIFTATKASENGNNNGSTETPKNKLVTTDGKSQYYKEDGTVAKNEWVTINNIKYYFNSDGYNASNEWINGKWISADGSCTYEGELKWKCNSTGWWVEDTKGWYPVSSWQKIDGIWYYFNASGYMASNEYYNGYWFNSDGSWDPQYFLTWKSNSTGWWVEDKSGWWPSSQWLKIDGSWYYFDASGYMVTNQYVDGYWLGSDGACQ